MSTNHECRPRTNNLNVKLNQFRDYKTQKDISIQPINTSDQLANYLTKAVNQKIMERI